MVTHLNNTAVEKAYMRLAPVYGIASRYELLATKTMAASADFASAEEIYEYGCGSGEFAAWLFERQLSETARYTGVDISADMLQIAQHKLSHYAARATLQKTSGEPPAPATAPDRFICNFVLDILPDEEISTILEAAHTNLTDTGKICLASLAPQGGQLSKPAMAVWQRLYAMNPSLVGGCRPLELAQYLPPQQWRIIQQKTLTPFLIPLEVIVAEKV